MGAKAWILAAAALVAACGGTGGNSTTPRPQDDPTRGAHIDSPRDGQSSSRDSDFGGKGRGGDHKFNSTGH